MTPRALEIFHAKKNEIAVNTDKMFAILFFLQWLTAIVFAVVISPKTWFGTNSTIHIHLIAAIFLGGSMAGGPIYFLLRYPGHKFNQYLVGFTQILFSGLFVHLTGGRIETHFHIFGSLAFLAFYRDLRPVCVGTLTTIADHLLRGHFWPQSVYGILYATPWRAIEHGGWVMFEVIVLYYSIRLSKKEMLSDAVNQAQLEDTLKTIEDQVVIRTRELSQSKEIILEQQETLIAGAKMSVLGEMAGGIAHEINNPLAIIHAKADLLQRQASRGTLQQTVLVTDLNKINQTVMRIAKIVKGLRAFSRNGDADAMENVDVSSMIEEAVSICHKRYREKSVDLRVHCPENVDIECRPSQIEQVLVNLLANALDAVVNLEEKWVELDAQIHSYGVTISVTDSGPGISAEIVEKMMNPFFTTKKVGHGTGLGLSISLGIIRDHHGQLQYDSTSAHTRFTIELPTRQYKIA